MLQGSEGQQMTMLAMPIAESATKAEKDNWQWETMCSLHV